MIRTFKAYLACESGATALEWGLIAAGIAVMIVAVLQAIGASLETGTGRVDMN